MPAVFDQSASAAFRPTPPQTDQVITKEILEAFYHLYAPHQVLNLEKYSPAFLEKHSDGIIKVLQRKYGYTLQYLDDSRREFCQVITQDALQDFYRQYDPCGEFNIADSEFNIADSSQAAELLRKYSPAAIVQVLQSKYGCAPSAPNTSGRRDPIYASGAYLDGRTRTPFQIPLMSLPPNDENRWNNTWFAKGMWVVTQDGGIGVVGLLVRKCAGF
jgi:hypothetical protein